MGGDTLQISATPLHHQKLVFGLSSGENRMIVGPFLLNL